MYHHARQSLATSIITCTQDFVGSNNINLLSPNGQSIITLTQDFITSVFHALNVAFGHNFSFPLTGPSCPSNPLDFCVPPSSVHTSSPPGAIFHAHNLASGQDFSCTHCCLQAQFFLLHYFDASRIWSGSFSYP